MSGTLSVKVKVSSLITALEKALVEREKRYATQEQEQAKYEKAVEAYNLAVLKLIKAGKGVVEEASRNTYYDRNSKTKGKVSFSVTVLLPAGALPAEPERPDRYNEYEWKREREDITQAIRVLKMTEQEFVSASTYKSIAQYL